MCGDIDVLTGGEQNTRDDNFTSDSDFDTSSSYESPLPSQLISKVDSDFNVNQIGSGSDFVVVVSGIYT